LIDYWLISFSDYVLNQLKKTTANLKIFNLRDCICEILFIKSKNISFIFSINGVKFSFLLRIILWSCLANWINWSFSIGWHYTLPIHFAYISLNVFILLIDCNFLWLLIMVIKTWALPLIWLITLAKLVLILFSLSLRFLILDDLLSWLFFRRGQVNFIKLIRRSLWLILHTFLPMLILLFTIGLSLVLYFLTCVDLWLLFSLCSINPAPYVVFIVTVFHKFI